MNDSAKDVLEFSFQNPAGVGFSQMYILKSRNGISYAFLSSSVTLSITLITETCIRHVQNLCLKNRLIYYTNRK